MLEVFIVAVIVGLIAWLIAGIVPFLAPHQQAVGLIVFILYFVFNAGLVS